MSHLARLTSSLVPMLLEARKFREEGRIEEAREVIRRIDNTQMIRKIEDEEELYSTTGGDTEEGKWMVVDAMAVMDEISGIDSNSKGDDFTKIHKAKKGLGNCNESRVGMNLWLRWWNWCFGQRNQVVDYMS